MLPKSLGTWLAVMVGLLLLAVFCAGAGAVALFYTHGKGLPDVHQLADYEPPVMTRVYAGDGRLVQEYAVEGRVFVPIAAIPKRVVNAFISAEDQNFYEHHGIDFVGILRAVVTNIGERLSGSGRRMKGASTITQQVAQNFLLGKEYSYERKIREAILSVRIEQAFKKEHILELYLNEIYLGFGSYGVAAASMNYFNKSLDELTIAEAAFLAGLPKAPNNYHPIRRPEAARQRRDYVIGRMLEDGRITEMEAEAAKLEQIIVRKRDAREMVAGGAYFAEEVRRELAERYGDEALYKGGLTVRSSLDPFMQTIADATLREGLVTYDRRHGWRGPLTNLATNDRNLKTLQEMQPPVGTPAAWQLALVGNVTSKSAHVLLVNGARGIIPMPELTWARKWLPEKKRGDPITSARQVVDAGDVILVSGEKRADRNDPSAVRLSPGPLPEGIYGLRQMPDIEGAVVALDPHTGRVLALSGGFSIARSEFNRATQAMRQPGSAFKPFVYLTAMENGYTPSTLVLDAPFALDQGHGLPKWKPQNYELDYLGLTTLRIGLEKSHNLMTVRLAQALGMDKVADIAEKFGIVDKLPHFLAASLGSEVTTPLRLVTAYAELVNGGLKLAPTMIDRVQDRAGKTIYRHDERACPDCVGVIWEGQDPPNLPDEREQIAHPASVYQVVHMLEGVIQRGTGHIVSRVGKPLAGKTGTSNDVVDTWFVGFSPDLAVGVFVGFDEPRTLGRGEQGASVAAPIFRDFMSEVLKDQPAKPFRVPSGISFVRVNHDTGKPAVPGESDVILEAFKTGSSPISQAQIMGESDSVEVEVSTPEQPSAGGLY